MIKMTDFDAIVVGGGPAGSGAVMYLKRKNLKVLLLDKTSFPRDKTCGDGISGKSMALVRELGLMPDIEKREHKKITGVLLSSPNGTLLEVPIPKSKQSTNYGYVCRREEFDDALFQNAKKLADKTIENFTVTDLLKDGEQVIGVKGIKDGKEQEFTAKVVLAADGANSLISKKIGLGDVEPKHHIVALRAYFEGVKGMEELIELHFMDELIPGYFWIFPIDLEKGYANIGLGMVMHDMRKNKLNLEQALDDVIKNSKLLKDRFVGSKRVSQIKGWNLPLGSHRKKLYSNGVVLLGDAASLIDPFTGEGIGNALLSAKYAAQVIEEANQKNDFSEKMLKKYDDLLWDEIESELKASYFMQKMLKKKFLVNRIMEKASKDPELRDALSGTLVKDAPLKQIASSKLFMKLIFG